MEHLDAIQIARLECLKLVAGRTGRDASPADVIAAAAAMARFVLDGSGPEDCHGDGGRL